MDANSADQLQPSTALERRLKPVFGRLGQAGGITFIILSTLLIYLPAIRAGFIWDDPDYVVNNQTLRSAGGLLDMWTRTNVLPQWYPLVHTTFWVEFQLWGLNPLGYHLDNVLLHIASSLLLWRLLNILNVPGAWLAAAIFAVHPVQVESVAWVTERKNVLSGLLYLLSMLMYLKWDPPLRDVNNTPRKAFYYLAFIFFTGALLSKTVVATMPAAILVIIWWKRGAIRWKDIRPLIPFFILGLGLGLLTAYLEVHRVGAQSDRIRELNLSALDRILIAGRAICFYAGKLVFPWPTVFIYPQWKQVDPHVWWQWIFPVCVAVAIVALVAIRRRIGRGPAAGLMIFCGTLFPALGFLNVYPMRFSYVADHFQYHASAALIALFAAGIWKYARAFGSVVLIPLAILTVLRTPDYRDAETLWRVTMARNPNSWMVQTNLGKVLVEKGENTGDEKYFEEAAQLYERALELDPHIHDTHTNVATMLARKGDYDRALAEFQKSIDIHPYFSPAYYGMGQVYLKLGDVQRAVGYLNKAMEIFPQYPQANYTLAQVLERQGDLVGAVQHYRSAVTFMPEDADSRYNLGSLVLRLRLYPEAIYNLREAVRIRPGWAQAWTNLGAAELAAGHPQDAAASFRKALSITPDLAPAQAGLRAAER